MADIGEQIQLLIEKIKINVRSLPFTLGMLSWFIAIVGCSLVWNYYARLGTVEVDDYRVIIAFLVPFLNLVAYCTEIPVLHFISIGVWFTNFPVFAALADNYHKSDGRTQDEAVAGYALIIVGQSVSFLANHEVWRHFSSIGDKTRRPLTLPAVVSSIVLGVGCLLLYYDTSQYNLLWSLPPLLVAWLFMCEIWVGIVGLAPVVMSIAAWATYELMNIILLGRSDSQWRSGSIAAYMGLIVFMLVLAWRTIERETSPASEKWAAMLESMKRNLRSAPFAISVFSVIITTIGAALLWFELSGRPNARGAVFFAAMMFFVPIINFIAFIFGIPIVHFAAAGLYFNGLGYVFQGILRQDSGSIPADYIMLAVGTSLSFCGHEQLWANMKAARSRFVDSVLRHPIFLLSCFADLVIAAGCIVVYLVPGTMEQLAYSVSPAVFAVFFMIHFIVDVKYLDHLLMFWVGQMINHNTISLLFSSNVPQSRAGYAVIFAGLIMVSLVTAWKKFRHPDDPEEELQDLGYEEI